MSRRSARLLVFLATALLAVLVFDGAPLSAQASSAAKAVHQTASIAVLPPVSQPSTYAGSTSAARSVIDAEFRPHVAGRPVVLERRVGSAWRAVDSARLDGAGRVTFTAPTRTGGRPTTYRVSAQPYNRLPAVHTQPAKTDAWGQPAFVDQFGGNALSPAWEHRGQAYNPGGGRMSSKGDPSAVAVGDGALRLSVLADPARANERFVATNAQGKQTGSYAYRLNGHVGTQSSFSFKYGVAAARMKFQHACGQHPSFWMQPQGAMNKGAEIDVIEWFGANAHRQRLMTNIYPHPAYETEKTWFGGRIDDPDRFLTGSRDHWWTGYHVFSVEWTPTEYVFRIDGHVSMRTTHGISHDPEYLILSMLSSDYELGYLRGDRKLPQHAYVDWVQVWTQK